MATRHYNFRIGREVSLLTEEEWSQIEPLLVNRIKEVQEYRKETGLPLSEALKAIAPAHRALSRFEEITGETLDHPDQLWSVRMSQFGSLCPKCVKPFRTPQAKLCAECGYMLPAGQVAGPLGESQ